VLTDDDIHECLTLLREISERPRRSRIRMAAIVAIAWAIGALMGMGL
jgi:hypothetical protein